MVDAPATRDAPKSLDRGLALATVKVRSAKALGRVRRLGPIDLRIEAGQRIAIIGPPGSGKTTLLRLLAGLEAPSRGAITWDDGPHPGRSALAHAGAMASDRAAWPRRRLRRLLRLDESAAPDEVAPLLKACGAGGLLGRLPDGLDARLSSHDLSSTERNGVAVARATLAGRSLVLLDEPGRRLSRRGAERMLEAVLGACAGATIIVTMRRPVALHAFDRVIALQRGRVRYDGPASEYGVCAAPAPAVLTAEREL